jgi:hypothetical protein
MSRPSEAISCTVFIFLTFQALYGLTSSGNVFRAPDEFEVYFQAEHLVDQGDLSVPQTLAIRQPVIIDGRVVGSQPMFFGTVGRDGKPYAPYGPLAAVLALPHHLIGRVVAAAAGVPRAALPGGIAWLIVVGGLTMLATATAGALAVAGFHRAALGAGAAPGDALVLSVLLGGATALWPYSTSFFSEAFQAAALIWAAALLLAARAEALKGERTRSAPGGCVPRNVSLFITLASLLLAVAGLTKVTSLIFTPAFVVAALIDRNVSWPRRGKVAVVLGCGIALAAGIHLAWNVWRFGSAFNFGYDWAETVPQLPARAFVLTDIPRGLAVLLLSPGKSLLVWAPPVLLAAAAFPRFWREQRAIAAGVATACATGLLFYAAYLFPEGGYAHGPRNLVPIVPLLLLPATARRWPRWSVVLCAAAGFAVALASTSVSYLDDQNIGGDLASGARTVYYERVTPSPGRAWNRYRLDYIPFAVTLTTPGWLHAPVLGQGPDYFPLHLAQARRQLPDGPSIPFWLVGAIPVFWITLLVGSAVRVYRC